MEFLAVYGGKKQGGEPPARSGSQSLAAMVAIASTKAAGPTREPAAKEPGHQPSNSVMGARSATTWIGRPAALGKV